MHSVTECPTIDVLNKTEQLTDWHIFLNEDFNFGIMHKNYCPFAEIVLAVVYWASNRRSGRADIKDFTDCFAKIFPISNPVHWFQIWIYLSFRL